jgi:hypothetical protein
MTTHPRTRRLTRLVAASVAVIAPLALTAGLAVVPAATAGAATCLPVKDLRTRAAAEVQRRDTTLDQLVAAITGTTDPYQVDGAQVAALRSAREGLDQLGTRIASACYPTREAARADVAEIFTGYRVYALRVPQTRVLEAGDHLGSARAQLGDVSTKLAAKVGTNAAAAAALHAMDADLAAADAAIGAPPAATGPLAAVPGLQPAKDLGPTTAALQAARASLTDARSHLASARTHALAAVRALGG